MTDANKEQVKIGDTGPKSPTPSASSTESYKKKASKWLKKLSIGFASLKKSTEDSVNGIRAKMGGNDKGPDAPSASSAPSAQSTRSAHSAQSTPSAPSASSAPDTKEE
ncbi:hypothetical protein DI09_15p460 [Mitosporidium daphniae]|uniref:Uncharacterized protein n=1 Tax=Mitosporidium daphniae TaxID=1485682 RepID=A0A098VUN7_9MICR|nr:uncharacterized protein DI09_15p460 [Mitosporidium daphniae]KGG52579.1 hypothetical protein DI09_15p460 [Mitosporidium daphniae]|eukprot:XP_013239006.1 uncharacterized protein DI09_15p460 [Mitosporidium daphniae]